MRNRASAAPRGQQMTIRTVLTRALTLCALVGAVAAAVPAVARAEDDAARRAELAQAVVRVVDVERAMEVMLEAMGPEMFPNTGNLSALEHRRRVAIVSEVLGEVGPRFVERFLVEMSDLYAETFTVEELEALLEFYDTPVGRSITEKSYVLGMRMELLMQQLMPEFVRDLLVALCVREGCDPEEALAALSPA